MAEIAPANSSLEQVDEKQVVSTGGHDVESIEVPLASSKKQSLSDLFTIVRLPRIPPRLFEYRESKLTAHRCALALPSSPTATKTIS